MYGPTKCQNCGHKLKSDTFFKWGKIRCPTCDVNEANKTWQARELAKYGEKATD